MATRRQKGRKNRRSNKSRRSRKQRGGATLTVTFPAFQATAELPTRLLAETQPEPKVEWAPQPSLTTLLVWDPDATATSWVHWLVTNCKGSDPSSGTEVMPWAPPSPPAGTGRHRYLFGLFTHSSPVSISLSERGNVAVEDLIQRHGLKEVARVGFRTAA